MTTTQLPRRHHAPTAATVTAPDTAGSPPRDAAQHAPAGTSSGTTPRDPWLDNARLVAAVLIVIMHFAENLRPESATLDTFYYGTWAFRLPVYIIIAGYFSHPTPLGDRRSVHLLRNILFVYLTMYCLSFVGGAIVTGHWGFNPARPSFALWFLLALFWWRITLPFAARIRFIVPISLVLAVAVGFFPTVGHTMAASRTIALWPLFLLGWLLREGRLRKYIDRAAVRAAAIVVIPLTFTGAALIHEPMRSRYFAMDHGYAGTLLQQAGEAGLRLAILGYGAVGALAIMSLLPRHRLPVLTYLGSGSFYIYLLHPLLLGPLRSFELMPMTDGKAEIMAYMLACAAIAMMLGSRPVRAATRWLIQPRYTWLFTNDVTRSARV